MSTVLTQSKVDELFKQTIEEVKDILPLDTNKIFKKVSIIKTKTSLGRCTVICGRLFKISLSQYLLECDEKLIKEVIIHELIHTLKGCFNHGYNFKCYMYRVNSKTNYNITTRNKDPQFGQKVQYKYKLTCLDCGRVFYRNRLSKWFAFGAYKHACGGKLKIEQLY